MNSTRKVTLLLCTVIALCFVLILINLFLILLMRKQQKKEALKENMQEQIFEHLQEQSEYMKSLQSSVHNHYRTLFTMINEGSYEQAQQLLQSLTTETNAPVHHYTDHTLADAILNQAAQACTGISFTVSGHLPSTITLPDPDLSSLLLNLLRNASEAAVQCDPEQAFVKVILQVSKGWLHIRVHNSIAKVPVFPEGVRSTKKNPEEHGFGLSVIERICHKYNGSYSLNYSEDMTAVADAYLLLPEEKK